AIPIQERPRLFRLARKTSRNKCRPAQHYRSESIMHSATSRHAALTAIQAHWPEYLIEGASLGIFMVSACVFVVLFEHPSSAVHQSFENASMFRRALIGVAMGLTAIGIIHSPWGQRSGAHMNPAVTLTFLSLGKIAPWDALFYVMFQFLGGVAGVLVA